MFNHGTLVLFQPSQVPGIRLWLDASNVLKGSNPPDNTNIATWVDLSGISGNATQATAGKRPLFVQGVQNGLPGIGFSSPSLQCMQVASVAVGSQLTCFVVLQSVSANSWFLEQSPDINSNDGFYMYDNGFATQIKNSGSSVMSQNIAGWLGTQPVIGMIKYDGTFVEVYKNGTNYPGSTGSGTITNNTVTNVLNIGSRNQASLFFNGFLHELILYNGALSVPQINIINDYLNRKWDIY